MLRRSQGWTGSGLIGSGVLGLGVFALCLLFAAPSKAQEIPPPLRDWQAWVLHDVPQHACPFLTSRMPGSGGYRCAWPGRLTLDVGKDGGRFRLDVHVDAPSWVALPGDGRHWPQQVSSNSQPAIVLQRQGQPMLWLTPGDYQLRGTLPWTSPPAQLRVPGAIGLVALSVDGKAVARVERDGDQLTLGEAAAAQRAADALAVRVYRRLDDGLPATLRTQLQFNVTGSAREQMVGPALPIGFVAIALASDLPARLDGDGRLRVQLRPGNWTVTLDARAVAPLARVALKLSAAPWPRQEIWSYADDTGLRSTRVEGNATDAAQAGVPDDWRRLPAYALDDAAGLTIETVTRGDEGGQGDQLRLHRQLWLDFDGHGLSIADHLSGELRHHQRLDVAAPWQLQRASQDGQPLLITQGENGRSGVELRDRKLDFDAGLRLAGDGGAIPTAGWKLPLEGIDANLHLPYGYRLLGAPGADRSPDSWVAQWSLLDLFIVALIALLAGRLLGWRWALLAAGFLMLAQHESGAPRWTLALVLALALLLRALPEGRLRLWARIGALAILALAVLWALPFAATELQYALHPQLERGASSMRAVQANFIEPPPPPPVEETAAPAPPAPASMLSANRYTPGQNNGSGETLKAETVAGARFSPSAPVGNEQDTRSLIQAGGGTPHWDVGNDYRLDWSGPVTTAQTSRLVIAPAWLVRLLRVAMVALLAALLARLVPLLLTPLRARWSGWRGGGAASSALLMLALLPWSAHAQSLPSQELLSQLRSRLTEAPKCAPSCAAVPQATLQVRGDVLDVELDSHTGAAVAVPLPQPDEALQLLDVSVDGHAAAPLLRQQDQLLLRMERGVHRVSLHYRLSSADNANLRFVLHPQRISFGGSGWSAGGIDDGRLLGDSVALNRVRSAGNGKDSVTAQSFPPYVRLVRRLEFGLDWRVVNTAERIAPQSGGFSTTLPLLPGEHPLGADALVKDGRINITFNASRSQVQWTSRLDHAAQLTLKAPPLGDHAEVWEVDAAPMWHVEAKGVPTSASDDGLLFQPLPGESLQLALTQPLAVAGDSLAFDSVRVASIAGKRATETTLRLHARSTRGGEHAIRLPPGAELLQASRDGESINLAVRDGKLGLPLLPGVHDFTLRLREPGGAAKTTRTPSFGLLAPAANIDLSLRLPQDRWVLWSWGPTDGPAVLYWPQLVVLLLVAWLLARYAPTPLRLRQWLLLGLGFSAFAWSAFALVVVWLILMGLRDRSDMSTAPGSTRFNLQQLGLVALTLLALAVLVGAVPQGLLGLPDMHVSGNGSTAWNLRWFADQTTGGLPRGGVFSVSLWVYKLAMLAWALWLANALIGWLRWCFEAWTRGGYWRKPASKLVAAPPPMPEPPHDA
jgi:hypothetical protein